MSELLGLPPLPPHHARVLSLGLRAAIAALYNCGAILGGFEESTAHVQWSLALERRIEDLQGLQSLVVAGLAQDEGEP
jgi:hypothetical protein